MNILTHLQMNGNQILSASFHKLASAPVNPVEGQFYYDTIEKVLKVWNGSRWLIGGAEDYPTLTIDNISGLKAQLDNKVNKSQVLTNVPVGAIFTDTITSINGKTGAITIADLHAMGVPEKDTVTTINGKTGVITKSDIVALGIPDKDTNTTYSIFTPSENGLVPKAANTDETQYLRADGKWVTPPDTDTKYTKASLGLGNVDNTSDKQKPLSAAAIEALSGKAEKAMVIEEASKAENAAKAHADAKISALIGGSPAVLDTLKEIADALGSDPNFSKTMLEELSKRPELHKEVVGNTEDKAFTITHKLNTRDVVVTIRQTEAPYEVVYTDISIPTVDTVKVSFLDAPASKQYTVVIVG